MQLNNILIVGDSFCEIKKGWPDLLGNKFSHAKVSSYGYPAAGWWAIRKHFLDIQKQIKPEEIDLLIYVHTFKARPFTVEESIRGTSPVLLPSEYSNNDFAEPVLAISLYYKYLFDPNFADWAEQQWFEEYKKIAKLFPRVMNLFLSTQMISPDLPGINVLTGLKELAMKQHNSEKVFQTDKTFGYQNHFSTENNQILADQLYEILTGHKTDFDIVKFKHD